jgi:hypothetical protein
VFECRYCTFVGGREAIGTHLSTSPKCCAKVEEREMKQLRKLIAKYGVTEPEKPAPESGSEHPSPYHYGRTFIL